MKKLIVTTAVAMFISGCAGHKVAKQHAEPVTTATASEIIARANADEWREVNLENVIKISLPTGAAYIELNPQFAPKHVENIKKLAREGFYQDTNMYRFVEGFVAQGGNGGASTSSQTASKSLRAEFYLTTQKPLAITALGSDGYAVRTGYLNGFAVAQNQLGTQTWQVHCNGVFAMARDNDMHSAATEFFVTIGQGPRYLDKNITVFGRVLEGMQHFNRLQRTPTKGMPFNPITDLQVLADIKEQDTSRFKVLKTDSIAFKRLMAARKNRAEAWFVYSANYIDVCALTIPTQRVS
jgi:cyclophilin family peptidyl-prolyl cis-trans isomerase